MSKACEKNKTNIYWYLSVYYIHIANILLWFWSHDSASLNTIRVGFFMVSWKNFLSIKFSAYNIIYVWLFLYEDRSFPTFCPIFEMLLGWQRSTPYSYKMKITHFPRVGVEATMPRSQPDTAPLLLMYLVYIIYI